VPGLTILSHEICACDSFISGAKPPFIEVGDVSSDVAEISKLLVTIEIEDALQGKKKGLNENC
jgi:hypothetical protein